MINEQERELERAILDCGKYQLCGEYKRFEISEEYWFTKMSWVQREEHIRRVLSYKIGSRVRALMPSTSASNVKPTCSRRLFTDQHSAEKRLSVEVGDFSSEVLIQRGVLDAIWSTATELVNDPKAIYMVPGGSAKDRIVKSSSGPRPHMVTSKKLGQYACDSECPNWKSLKICSHTVAAAQDNDDLHSFTTWLKKTKKTPNITNLLTTKMPKGRGRKGCAPPSPPPRKRKKKIAASSRKSFAQVLRGPSEERNAKAESPIDSNVVAVKMGISI